MALKGRTKKDVLAEFRHEEILDAARAVFAQKGFREASVDAIAQQAGLAKGTVYLYYPSKEALYQAALEHGLAALSTEVTARVGAAKGLRAKVHAFVSAKVEHFEKHRDFFRIYYSEMGNAISHPAYREGRLKELYLQQLALLKDVLIAARKAGEVKDVDPELVACTLFDLTRGLITQRLLGWSERPAAQEVDTVVSLIWNGLARQ